MEHASLVLSHFRAQNGRKSTYVPPSSLAFIIVLGSEGQPACES